MTNLKKIIEEWKEMRVKIGDAFTSNAILKDYKYDDVNMMVQALEEAVEAMKSYTNSVTSYKREGDMVHVRGRVSLEMEGLLNRLRWKWLCFKAKYFKRAKKIESLGVSYDLHDQTFSFLYEVKGDDEVVKFTQTLKCGDIIRSKAGDICGGVAAIRDDGFDLYGETPLARGYLGQMFKHSDDWELVESPELLEGENDDI